MLEWSTRKPEKGVFAAGSRFEYRIRIAGGRGGHKRCYTLHYRAGFGTWDHAGIFDTLPQARAKAAAMEAGDA